MNRTLATSVSLILLVGIGFWGDVTWRANSLERSWRPVGEPWEEWVEIRPPTLVVLGSGGINGGTPVAWGWQGSAWFRDGNELISPPAPSPPKYLQSLLDDLVPTSRKFSSSVDFNACWKFSDSTFDPPKSAGIPMDRYVATPRFRLRYSVRQETGVSSDVWGRRTKVVRWHARQNNYGTWAMDFKLPK